MANDRIGRVGGLDNYSISGLQRHTKEGELARRQYNADIIQHNEEITALLAKYPNKDHKSFAELLDMVKNGTLTDEGFVEPKAGDLESRLNESDGVEVHFSRR